MFAVVQVILFVFSAIYCPCKLFCKICVRVMETKVKKIPHVESWKIINGWLLCSYLLTRPKMPFKGMHRKEVTHSNGFMRGNRVGGNWLMKWDEVKKKSHDTLIDWRTGREWPLNCMTVISAWWRLNIRFQRWRGWSSWRWTII